MLNHLVKWEERAGGLVPQTRRWGYLVLDGDHDGPSRVQTRLDWEIDSAFQRYLEYLLLRLHAYELKLLKLGTVAHIICGTVSPLQ